MGQRLPWLSNTLSSLVVVVAVQTGAAVVALAVIGHL
jgi:hypothetical protein